MPRVPVIDESIAARVRAHYRKMGVMPGWTKARMVTLCVLANRTPEEIGALAGLEPNQTRYFLKKDRFPPSASIHFLVIDKVLKEAKFGEPWMPVVPLDLIERK